MNIQWMRVKAEPKQSVEWLIVPSVTDGQPYRSAYGYTQYGHRVSLYVVRNRRQLYIAIRERKVPCKRGFDYNENVLSYRD